MASWVLGCFVVAALAPLVAARQARFAGVLLAAWPAYVFVQVLLQPLPAESGALISSLAWAPSLGLNATFLLDGLSRLMALLITGIGSLIILYAHTYLDGHAHRGRLLALLMAFMGAMLGLVLSGNLLLMFFFWEMTSIVSYLLIGFDHDNAQARKSALQGLFVTFAGGLCLMTGLILLGQMADSYEWGDILAAKDLIASHELYTLTLLLIVAGAFTKSAQFPFHFWLPNAMAAPTPVSAYLHSATMVKAGVFLLARLTPVMGGTALWTALLGTTGAITLLLGVWLAMRSTGVKRVLAYSTIMALGTLTMLLGIGSEKALVAAMAFLLAHSLYKGALFMVAGILDHAAGIKDLRDSGGLRRPMPLTATAAVLAALSLAGALPMFGFVAKEKVFMTLFDSGMAWLTPVVALGAILTVGVGALVGIQPWFGRTVDTARPAHDPHWTLLAGPLILSVLGVLFGLLTPWVDKFLLAPAASAVAGHTLAPMLALWHGLNLALALSIATLALGLLLYRWRARFRDATRFSDAVAERGPEQLYHRLMAFIPRIANWQTRALQTGYLRHYLVITLLCTLAAAWHVLGSRFDDLSFALSLADMRLQELVVALVMCASAIAAATTSSRLGAVAALGAVGFTVALVFVLFSAADPGITQVLVETLTVILLVLVLFRLPKFSRFSDSATRARDAGLAILVGATFTLLLLATPAAQLHDSIADWHILASVPEGYGRNIVNVILVDFRALDTLGEIFVLALAAVGVMAMIGLKAEGRKP